MQYSEANCKPFSGHARTIRPATPDEEVPEIEIQALIYSQSRAAKRPCALHRWGPPHKDSQTGMNGLHNLDGTKTPIACHQLLGKSGLEQRSTAVGRGLRRPPGNLDICLNRSKSLACGDRLGASPRIQAVLRFGARRWRGRQEQETAPRLRVDKHRFRSYPRSATESWAGQQDRGTMRLR
jgi:hypothetical protein